METIRTKRAHTLAGSTAPSAGGSNNDGSGSGNNNNNGGGGNNSNNNNNGSTMPENGNPNAGSKKYRKRSVRASVCTFICSGCTVSVY